MRSLNLLYFALVGSQLNTIFLTCSTIFTLGLFLHTSNLTRRGQTSSALTYPLAFQALTLGLVGQGFLFLFTFFCYLRAYVFAQETILLDPLVVFKVETLLTSSFCTFSISLYGYVIILLALFVGLFALLVSENKIKQSSYSFLFYFNYFLLMVYLLVSINDVIGLFICYELLLIPSFLFVYFVSYTRKALQASLYFVIWTQVGSLLVLIACVYMVTLTGNSSFNTMRLFPWTQEEGVLIYSLFFFGFGLKFPLWPFHY
jgi:formate hydrogenlyase subunit 3/multisubunit Na+/H+ antiporter MnhD subunit